MREYPGFQAYLLKLGEPDGMAEGKHSKVLLYSSAGLAVKLFKDGLLSSYLKELRALKLLTEVGKRYPQLRIAPELYFWEEKLLAIEMELVKGFPLKELIGRELEARLKLELAERMLEAAILLDLLRVQKEEMARPHKHVIITQLQPVRVKLIDFDRSTYPGKPVNLPQLLQFLRAWLKLPEGGVKSFGKLYKSKLLSIGSSHEWDLLKLWGELLQKAKALIGGS